MSDTQRREPTPDELLLVTFDRSLSQLGEPHEFTLPHLTVGDILVFFGWRPIGQWNRRRRESWTVVRTEGDNDRYCKDVDTARRLISVLIRLRYVKRIASCTSGVRLAQSGEQRAKRLRGQQPQTKETIHES